MIGGKISCGLDIGSRQIKASLVRPRKNSDPELIGLAECPTRGLKESTVTDLGQLAQSVQGCLSDLSVKTGMRVKEVNLGVSGHFIEARFSQAVIPLLERGHKVITKIDIERVKKDACFLGINMEEAVLHCAPIMFTLDDRHQVISPLGLHGHKLKVELLMIVAKENLLNNVVKAVNQAGFEAAGVHYSSYAAATAVFDHKAMKDGCLLIDVGASITGLLLFKEGVLQKLELIPFGGEEISTAIASQLQLSGDLAEDIKKSHADVVSEEDKKREEILVKREENYVPVKRDMIFAAADSRIRQFLTQLKQIFDNTPQVREIGTDIILIGGSALLTGLIERMERQVQRRIKLGKLLLPTSFRNIGPGFYAAVGLALAKKSFGGGFWESMGEGKNSWEVLRNRVRELYYEYF